MSSLVISGDTSGAITVSAPAVAGTNTLTLLAATATNSVNVLATAVASTSGTSIDFTGLPAWIKRLTVMFTGVSTNGTSIVQIQLGSGSFTTTGYLCSGTSVSAAVGAALYTAGFGFGNSRAATVISSGNFVISNLTSNTWSGFGLLARSEGAVIDYSAGSIALGGVLDRVRITTVNGTDTFDAGTVNILYVG